MALTARTWLYLACLWLSIATALGHAMVPAGSPLERGQGSAFSASTSDVSLGASSTGAAKINRTAASDDQGSAPDFGPPLLAGLTPAPLAHAFARTLSNFGPALALSSFPLAHDFDARGPPRV